MTDSSIGTQQSVEKEREKDEMKTEEGDRKWQEGGTEEVTKLDWSRRRH